MMTEQELNNLIRGKEQTNTPSIVSIGVGMGPLIGTQKGPL